MPKKPALRKIEALTVDSKLMENCLVTAPVSVGNELNFVSGAEGELEIFTLVHGGGGDYVHNLHRDSGSDTGWGLSRLAIDSGVVLMDIAAGRSGDNRVVVFGAARSKDGSTSKLVYWTQELEDGRRSWSEMRSATPDMRFTRVLSVDAMNVDGELRVASIVEEQFDLAKQKAGDLIASIQVPYKRLGKKRHKKVKVSSCKIEWQKGPVRGSACLYFRHGADGPATMGNLYQNSIAPGDLTDWTSWGHGTFAMCSTDGKQLSWLGGERRKVTQLPVSHGRVLDFEVVDVKNGGEVTPLVFSVFDDGELYECVDTEGRPEEWRKVEQGLFNETDNKPYSFTLTHVSAEYHEASKTVHVFTTAKGGRLCHMSRDVHGAWTPLIPLLDDVTDIASGVDAGGEIDVFATRSGGHLAHLWLDPSTGHWEYEEVEVQPEEGVERIRSFETEILVRDPKTGMPRIGEPVTISSDALDQLRINGRMHRVEPRSPISCVTDAAGRIRVQKRASSITTPVLHASVPGLKLESPPIDPSGDIAKNLATLSAADLGRSNLHDDSTGRGGPLVADAGARADISTAVQGAMKLANGSAPRQYWFLDTSRDRPNLKPLTKLEARHAIDDLVGRHQPLRAAIGPDTEFGFGFADVIGDVARAAAGSVFSEVYAIIVAGAEICIHAAIAGVEFVWNGIVRGVQQALEFVEVVFHAVAAGIDKVLDFLAHLFAWKDIVRTKDAIVGCLDSVLKRIPDIADGAADMTAEEVRRFALGAKQKLERALRQQKDGFGAVGAKMQPSGDVQRANSDNILANAIQAHGNQIARRAPAELGFSAQQVADMDDLIGELSALVDDREIKKELESVKKELGKISSPEKAVSESVHAISRVIMKLLLLILEKLPDMVASVVRLAGRVLTSFRSLLFGWEVPLISDVYRWAVKLASGSDPGPVHLIEILGLAAAIPATIVYKRKYHEAPFPSDASVEAFVGQYANRLSGKKPERPARAINAGESGGAPWNSPVCAILEGTFVTISGVLTLIADLGEFSSAKAGEDGKKKDGSGLELCIIGFDLGGWAFSGLGSDEEEDWCWFVSDLVGLALDIGCYGREKKAAPRAGAWGLGLNLFWNGGVGLVGAVAFGLRKGFDFGRVADVVSRVMVWGQLCLACKAWKPAAAIVGIADSVRLAADAYCAFSGVADSGTE